MDEINKNWRNLAAGIINCAIEDRRKALAILRLEPKDVDAQHTLEDCEKFFASDWCQMLLDFCNVKIEMKKLLEAEDGC